MSNLFNALKVSEECAADVKRLREAIPILSRFSDVEVEAIYKRFSESYCAGWLILDNDRIQEFDKWMDE